MLEINGVPANKFIKEAYDLNEDLSGVGRYDLNDPIQTELRRVRDWIAMAESDTLKARSKGSKTSARINSVGMGINSRH